MKFKKIVVSLVSAALGILAWLSSATGCMEYLETKNYFGLGEESGLVFTIIFSLMVAAFSFQGFKNFIYDMTDKDKKK